MRRLLIVLALGAALGACKREPKNVDATEADCIAYRNKMFSFLPAEEQKSMDGPTSGAWV